MQSPNEYGVYPVEKTEELGRRGLAYVEVSFCHCEDGLVRYALSMAYSYGGFGGPIYAQAQGFESEAIARDAAVADLLARFPRAWPSEPKSVHEELKALREIIEAGHRQPTLF